MTAAATEQATPARLRVEDLTKAYGHTRALDAVTLEAHAGRGLALLGRNGAGKSTLIKILAGVTRPDSGLITVDGVAVVPTPGAATGLAFIHQDLGLIEDMTVNENIAFNRGFSTRAGLVSWGKSRRESQALLDEWDVQVNADDFVRDLSQVERSLVAIVRALSTDARCIVLDEPTAALPVTEVDKLLSAVNAVKARGIAIIYVTHRLTEVVRVTEDFVVLRDGAVLHSGSVADTPHDELVRLVVGEEAQERVTDVKRRQGGGVVLAAQGLRVGPLQDATFEVHAGEVLGLVGLEGAGHREAGRALAGALQASSGTLSVDGNAVALRTVRQAQRLGLMFLPGDRLRESAVQQFSCAENLQIKGTNANLWIARRAEREQCVATMAEWGVVAPSADSPLTELSGGNQQKLLLAKWVSPVPRLLVVEEPTAGVDVGARRQIHAKLREVAAGAALVVTSTDTEEISELCDRVLVFRNGSVANELSGDEITEARIASEVLASPSRNPEEQ